MLLKLCVMTYGYLFRREYNVAVRHRRHTTRFMKIENIRHNRKAKDYVVVCVLLYVIMKSYNSLSIRASLSSNTKREYSENYVFQHEKKIMEKKKSTTPFVVFSLFLCKHRMHTFPLIFVHLCFAIVEENVGAEKEKNRARRD